MVAPVRRGFYRTRGDKYSLHRRPDIFISHNSADKPFVQKLADALNKVGVDAWLDEWELEAGDSLHRSLGVALEMSRFVGIIISPAFIRSEWCITELEQALVRERREVSKVVIPILHKRAKLPAFVEGKLYVDFSKQFFVGLTELSRIVHGLSLKACRQAVASRTPKNIADVGRLLEGCGWAHESLFEPDDIDLLKKRFKKLSIGYVEDNGTMWIDDAALLGNRDRISDLKVASTLLEFLALFRTDVATYATAAMR